jgi:hypothetical protein
LFADTGYSNTTIFGGVNELELSTTVSRGNWTHIAFSKNSTAMSLYKNGAFVSSRANSDLMASTINPGTSNVVIGSNFGAAISEIRIWNKGLSSAQANLVYTNNSNVTHSSITTTGVS